jgi:hypothetical protein
VKDMDMFNELMLLVNTCEVEDLNVDYDLDQIVITIKDYDIIHDIDRKYKNPKAIHALKDWLEINCNEREAHFSIDYFFNDFMVHFTYITLEI